MEKSIQLLIEDLGNPTYKVSYTYGRPFIVIENDSIIDTWSLTNSNNGECAYLVDDILYVYRLHREIKQRPLDLITNKIKP